MYVTYISILYIYIYICNIFLRKNRVAVYLFGTIKGSWLPRKIGQTVAWVASRLISKLLRVKNWGMAGA